MLTQTADRSSRPPLQLVPRGACEHGRGDGTCAADPSGGLCRRRLQHQCGDSRPAQEIEVPREFLTFTAASQQMILSWWSRVAGVRRNMQGVTTLRTPLAGRLPQRLT